VEAARSAAGGCSYDHTAEQRIQCYMRDNAVSARVIALALHAASLHKTASTALFTWLYPFCEDSPRTSLSDDQEGVSNN
jgi:hypothetical protein